MSGADDDLYRELKRRVVAERLKEISVDVIERYRRHDRAALAGYATLAGVDAADMDLPALFAAVIQRYHPDKLTAITASIDALHAAGDGEGLLRVRRMYCFERAPRPSVPDDFELEEVYGFDEDFEDGAVRDAFREAEETYEGEEPPGDYEPEEGFGEWDTREEYGFIEALNDIFFGNLDLELEAGDLRDLEGELDLSDFGIVDLEGAERCVNVTSLNLSCNRIESVSRLSRLECLEALYLSDNAIRDIAPLAGLSHVRELDLSFNRISDISPLLDMDRLAYVNLMGNPVAGAREIELLRARGVLVIV